MKTIEPRETYTNLAYSLFGFLLYYLTGDVLVCLAFQVASVSSFVWHKYKERSGQLFDWWGMCFMNTVIAGYHLDNTIAWTVLIVWLVMYSYLIMGNLGVYIEVAISSIIALAAIIYNTSWLNGALLAAYFAICIYIRSKDIDPKQEMDHDSIYHAAWHPLTGFGWFMAFANIIYIFINWL